MHSLPRNYITFRSDGRDDYNCDFTMSSDPYEIESVRNEDRMLHRTLSEIFRERRLSRDQIKELSRSSAGHADQNSMFKLLLEREPALGYVFPKNNKLSLLWTTVLCCYQNSAELLVRSGADVKELYSEEQSKTYMDGLSEKSSILHALAKMYPSLWNERFMALVLEHGAADLINARDVCGRSAMLLAAKHGSVQMNKLLLEKGADVNSRMHNKGCTPVLFAADCNVEVDKLLPLMIKHGADLTATSVFGNNIWQCLSASEDYVNLARLLIENGAPLEPNDRCICSPLYYAISQGKNEVVELILDHGVDVNAIAQAPRYLANYRTPFPLHVAAKCDNPTVLRTLLKRGANIDLKTKLLTGSCLSSRETALHYASRKLKVENIRILLSVGADIFAEDNKGRTPIVTFIDAIIHKYHNRDLEHPGIRLMLKTLAVRKACPRLTIKFEDELRIKAYDPALWLYYQECQANICKMKFTRFMERRTFFEFLTNCHCQIAPLMSNPEFETEFRRQDLDFFSMFAEDVREAFERVRHCYESTLEQEKVINEAVDYVLPELVVRKVARYILICEECEMKKVAQASRSLQQ